jgi:hypothetical protein
MSRSYRENILPSRVAALISDDYAQYRTTLSSLHQIWRHLPAIQIVPSHCGEFFDRRVKNCFWDRQSLNGTLA